MEFRRKDGSPYPGNTLNMVVSGLHGVHAGVWEEDIKLFDDYDATRYGLSIRWRFNR